MSDIFDISQMTEEDIKLQYITPALTAKWDIKKITMETSPVNNFTDGKVRIKGNIPSRDKGKRCDYVLWYNKGTPLAIIEAKDNNKSSSYGMQQAITYGIIVVQVKSYDKDVQALKGAMHNNDYGLFVTLSDYSENAKKYLNAHTEIRGISGSELVDLLLQYYDKLSDKYRAIIPLKKVYIPDVNEEDNK